MKRIVTFLILVFAIVVARADFIIQQKTESAAQNGDTIIKIQGDKIRVDMPSSPMGKISTIMDLITGDSTVLMHNQKMAVKISAAQMRQMTEAMKKQMNNGAGSIDTPKTTDTGKAEKVGDYRTEIYIWSNSRGMSQTLWVAKDFPNFKKINAQLERLSNSAAGGMAKDMSPDITALPGMVVKSQAEMAGQKVTITLVSVKETAVDASVFEIPKDYHDMAQPAATVQPQQK